MPDTPNTPDAPLAPDAAMSPAVGRSAEQSQAGGSSAPAPALAKTLSRGTAWMVASNVITKGASILTFAVVAGKLNESDIGVWTLAFSFAAFTQFFRDGGVSQLLIQRGDKEYERLSGPVFWMALMFNLATASVLAALAPLAASERFYDEPRLLPLLLVMAAVMPIMTPATVLWARLQIQLRFGTLSRIQTVSSLIRYGGTVGFVLLGLGPISFVLPMPIIAIYENIAYYVAVRDKPWLRPARAAIWGDLFRDSKWLVFVTFAFAVVNQGLFFVLGKLLSTAELGVFSMSYQMVTQIDQLLAATAAIVLYAALSKLNDEPERQRAATLRAGRLMTLMSSLASFGLLATIAPIERLLWAGKWDAAIVPAQIVAVAFAWRVLLWVPAPALQAQGKFRFSAVLVLLAGAGLTLAGAVGARYGGGNPVPIGMAVAVFTGVGFLLFSLWGMAAVGVRVWDVIRQTVPTWLCVGVAGSGAALMHGFIHPRLVDRLVQPVMGFTDPAQLRAAVEAWAGAAVGDPASMMIGGGVLSTVVQSAGRLVWETRLVAAIDLAVTGAVFALLAFGLLRLLLPGIVREAADLLPARLAFVRRFA